jgi:hypothetical protein
MEHAFTKAKLLMHQSRGLKNKAKLWESLKGQGGGNLGETFTSC